MTKMGRTKIRKRLVCMLLGHIWENIERTKVRSRGCLRCDKHEAQIEELAIKYPDYWHHVDWEWDAFKEWFKKWEERRLGKGIFT